MSQSNRQSPARQSSINPQSAIPTSAILEGVRVLDLTRLLPGAYCTLLLAELGAEIVKIEAPDGGDPLRRFTPATDGVGAYFRALNRNKRSVTLDLRAAEAAPVLHALVAGADVLVESFRPSTARRLGVDAASLLAAHPGLVHCSISGYGQSGPYAERPGHDINYMALSGLLALDHRAAADRPADRMRPSRAFVSDLGGGAQSAAIGILAGLVRRARTGAGAAIDISMHDGALAWLMFPGAPLLADPHAAIAAEPPMDDAACYAVYEAGDGRHLALGALEPKFWARFCEGLGRPDLIDRQAARGADAQRQLYDEVARTLAARTRDEWLAIFADADTCLTPVHDAAAALADPHARARASVVSAGDGRYLRGPIRMSAGTPLRAIELPAIAPAPVLGADTDALLDAAGIAPAVRADLRARRVI